MRTNIDLDEELVERAKKLTGIKTKRAIVHEALRTLIFVREQAEVRRLRGKLEWQGDLQVKVIALVMDRLCKITRLLMKGDQDLTNSIDALSIFWSMAGYLLPGFVAVVHLQARADTSHCECSSRIHKYEPLASKKRATRLRREGGRILLDSCFWLSSCFQNPALQKAEPRNQDSAISIRARGN